MGQFNAVAASGQTLSIVLRQNGLTAAVFADLQNTNHVGSPSVVGPAGSSGTGVFYAPDGAYEISLYSAGTLMYSAPLVLTTGSPVTLGPYSSPAGYVSLPTNAQTGTVYVSKGSGASDSSDGLTAATAKSTIAAAIATAPTGGLVQLLYGTWTEVITQPPNGIRIAGVGWAGTIISVTATSGIGIDLTSCQRVQVENLQIALATTATAGLAVNCNAAFTNKFLNVWFSGQHTSSTSTTYHGQIGVNFSNNAGDSNFIGCLWANLGVGVTSSAIQNGLESPKFTNCWKGILTNGAGGISVTGYCDILGDNDTQGLSSCDYAIQALGTGQHWIEQIWSEKTNLASVQVGSNSGTPAGPSVFVIGKSYLGGFALLGIDIQCATLVEMEGMELGSQPTPIQIDATNAPVGVINGMETASVALTNSMFPTTWDVAYRSGGQIIHLTPSSGTIINKGGALKILRASDGAAVSAIGLAASALVLGAGGSNATDLVKMQDTGGVEMAGFDSVTSSVNYPYLSPAVTGSSAVVGARGTDTNVGLSLKPKGAGVTSSTDNGSPQVFHSAASLFYPAAVGQWYANPLAFAQRTTAPTLNEGFAHIFFSGPQGMTIDQLDVNVSVVGTSSTARTGIYTITDQIRPFKWAANSAWATLLLDCGTVATTGTGQVINTLGTPQVIPPNTWFSVVAVEQGTAAATRFVAGTSGSFWASPLGNGTAAGYNSSPGCSLTMTGITSTLPGTFTPNGAHAINTDGGVGIHRSA